MRKTVFLAAMIAACGAQAAAQRPPNILFIISDDIGMDATTSLVPGLIDDLARQYGPAGLRHPGAAAIKGHAASVPNLDKLAKQGIAFSNVWAQPFCSPTRASILTGLSAAKANVINYTDPLSPKFTSFVQKLKDEGGYSTGLFGKWHLAGMPGGQNSYPGMKPKQAGFEVFKGNMHAAIKTYWDWDYMEQDASTPADQWRTSKAPVRSLPGIAPTTYSGVVQVADAIEWISAREKAEPNKPWFSWVAFNLAHATSQQQPSAMMVPSADTLDAASAAEMKACNGTFGTQNTGTCTGEALLRAMTNSMDTLIGRLLAEVDRLDPNTVVIYIGDNGTPMYGRPNLDFIDNMYITRKGRGKGTAYESGARVPVLIRGPGIAGNRVNHEPLHSADMFPTILTLAGVTVPTKVSNADGSGTFDLDGVALQPLITGKARNVRDPDQGYMLTESLNLMTNSSRQIGARNGTYKVICSERTEPGNCVFYNLKNDPLEEYPLEKPANCNGTWTTKDPEWHYCRLNEMIRTKSFFAMGR